MDDWCGVYVLFFVGEIGVCGFCVFDFDVIV